MIAAGGWGTGGGFCKGRGRSHNIHSAAAKPTRAPPLAAQANANKTRPDRAALDRAGRPREPDGITLIVSSSSVPVTGAPRRSRD
jgi:hypothetical protein